MLTDPSEILALAGLTLPSGVTDVQATAKPLTGVLKNYQYAYTVSWNGTIDTTNEFLTQVNRTLATMGRYDNSFPLALYTMVVDDVPDGSRLFSANFPTIPGYGALDILAKWPDFTKVYVGVASFPS